MLKDIVEVRHVKDYRLFLRFEDGMEGEVDLASFVRFDGVFEMLKDPAQFALVRVHPELGSIYWPNEADSQSGANPQSGPDLDSDVLYSKVTGKPVTIP